MKIFARYLTAIALLLTISACSKDEHREPPPPEVRHHTVVLYMPGRSLMTFYRENIERICLAVERGALNGGRMMVCYQPESHTRATLCEIERDRGGGASIKTVDVFDFDASSSADLARMFRLVEHSAPAESYGLIVGSHGKAWLPAEAGVIRDELSLSHHADRSDDLWRPLAGALTTRSLGDSGHEIDINGFDEAISATGCRFDYIIFDACFMANIETLYDLRNSTDYIVASPCEIMGAGFPYDRIAGELYATDRPLDERLTAVCRAFYDLYQNYWDEYPNNEQSGCISLCATAALDNLCDVTGRITATPIQDYDPAALQSYEGLANHIFYDFGQYIRTAYNDTALLEEFDRAMDAAFPVAARLHTEAFYSAYNRRMNPIDADGYSGVTTSSPSLRYRDYLEQTAWYQATE